MDTRIQNAYVYVYYTNNAIHRYNEIIIECPNVDIVVHNTIDEERGIANRICYVDDSQTPITVFDGPKYFPVNYNEGSVHTSGNALYTVWFREPNIQKAKYYIFKEICKDISLTIANLENSIPKFKQKLEQYQKLMNEAKQ